MTRSRRARAWPRRANSRRPYIRARFCAHSQLGWDVGARASDDAAVAKLALPRVDVVMSCPCTRVRSSTFHRAYMHLACITYWVVMGRQCYLHSIILVIDKIDRPTGRHVRVYTSCTLETFPIRTIVLTCVYIFYIYQYLYMCEWN